MVFGNDEAIHKIRRNKTRKKSSFIISLIIERVQMKKD